ncbi:MAG: hypothetical protein JWM75_445 [Sphingomonas bacterium]|nr:hypothetical protein [Sphingomonas bacterium]
MRMPCCWLLLMIAAVPAAAQGTLSPADQAAAYRAAGFTLQGRQWRACDAPSGSVYSPGKIETVRDLNGDGRPEAVITEGSSFCFGGDEVGYTIVSKQPDGAWKRITAGAGIVHVLATRGVGGWPDIEIGGQGFCFPVYRWDGRSYEIHRHQYQRKPCRPAR